MSQAVQIILYLGAIQGILLSVFLFSIKANRISNRLLGLLTFFLGIMVGTFAIQQEGLYIKFPHLLKVFYMILFTLFPLLYLQVKYLLSNHKKFNRNDLIHFLPLLVMVILYAGFYVKSGEDKIAINMNKSTYYAVLQMIGDEIIAIQGVIYSILALKLLSKYKQKVMDYQSNVDKMILKVQYAGISLSLFAWIICCRRWSDSRCSFF